ncbi:MAG: DNA polymerase I [Acidobacteria bacterium]|nr:DNA polymerase I [Acidobacteriota bacterium]
MSKPKLFLIDGMAQLYRSFFAVRQLSNSKGFPTNALFGFTMILRKLVKDDKPDYWAVCWDTPEPTFRHQLYPSYKAQRAAMPDELSPQVDYVEKLCNALNLSLIKKPGYEADDIIGTLALKAAKAGLQVIILSGDKDMGQLVNEDILVMRMEKGNYVLHDANGVKNWLGVFPNQIVDFLSLVGDTSDNVPGVAGIGDKGAAKLLEEFKTLDNLLENAEKVSRKSYREALLKESSKAILARQLVTLDTNVPIEFNLEQLKYKEADYKTAYEVFSEVEFKSLVQEFALLQPTLLNSPQSLVNNEEKLSYQKITSDTELKSFLDKLWANDEFSFIIELSSDNQISQMSFSFAPGNAYQFDFNLFGLAPNQVLEPLQDIWSNGFLAKKTHDSKQALIILNNFYQKSDNLIDGATKIAFENLTEDTLLAAYLLNPEENRYSLVELAQEYLGVSSDNFSKYDKADIIGRLAIVFHKKLQEMGLEDIYLNFELPLVEIIYNMERVGIKVDLETLSELSKEFDEELKTLSTEIYALAGQEFNINSPMQLATIFEKLNIHISRKTATGKVSTSADVLDELAHEYELPRKVIDYREVAKFKNTYIDILPKLINSKTGRVHTTINQTVAATGRLSCSNPNLQSIPVNSILGRNIRKAFVADEGYILLSADYSQIELRLLAHIANDEKMTEAFQKGEDIHTKTAKEVFGAETEEELKAKRRLAKSTNFGIAYGVGAFGLAQRVGISRSEAKEAIEKYYATYTGIRYYMADIPEKGRQNQGIVRTIFGRIRRLNDLNNSNHNLRTRAEREAINAPIQGTAADLVKLAMIRIYNRLKEENLKSRMLLQVHDELLLEVLPSELDRVKELVKNEMEQVYSLKVPLVAEVHIGKNWLELK